MISGLMRTLRNLFLTLFPVFKTEDRKFFYLALASFFMMGALWPIKNLKDALLVSVLGSDNQPIARTVSVLLCFFTSYFYGYLVSRLRRENVLYIVISILFTIGLVFMALLSFHRSGSLPFNPNLVIYGFYIYSDILTVMTIPVFWAFVNDLCLPEEAKSGYPLIVFASQMGAAIAVGICAVLVDVGFSHLFISLISSFSLASFAGAIYFLVKKVGRDHLRGYEANSKKVVEKHSVPFLKGLFLIVTSPYVFGIFFLTFGQEVITSIMQFQMFKALEAVFLRDTAAMTSFMFKYSLLIQFISCTVSATGTFFQDKLGLKNCVILYPILVLFAFISTKLFSTLMVIAGAQAMIKGLHYALNKPSREMLYIPTTKEVKYKSKSWIESFGSRLFKVTGAYINKSLYGHVSLVTGGILVTWIFIANFVGGQYKKSVNNNETVV